MAFTPVPSGSLLPGKAVKTEILTTFNNNLNDHESRIQALSIGAAPIEVFHYGVINASAHPSLTGLDYYRAFIAFNITTVKLQIFEKGLISSGIISLDIKKGNTLDNLSFNSILTSQASIDFATASDYDEADAVIDPALQSLTPGQFLRLDITSLPSLPLGKFRVLVYGNI
jgi:hypothetical protein